MTTDIYIFPYKFYILDLIDCSLILESGVYILI